MFKTILIAAFILALCLIFLGLKMLLLKNGKFPNTHVSGNPKMKQCGVGCAQSQDRNSRATNKYDEFIASQDTENLD